MPSSSHGFTFHSDFSFSGFSWRVQHTRYNACSSPLRTYLSIFKALRKGTFFPLTPFFLFLHYLLFVKCSRLGTKEEQAKPLQISSISNTLSYNLSCDCNCGNRSPHFSSTKSFLPP
jgi:hypothetical protein